MITASVGIMKTCSKCKVEKALDQFQKNKARHDGVETYCRECNNARIRAKYAKDPNKKISKTREYHLANPEWSKEYQHNWHKENKDRRYNKIKQRLSTDKEFVKYRRELVARKERERRAQKTKTKVVKVTKKDYEEILVSFNNKCWICEQDLILVYWDHVHPLAKGGPHTKDNLRPSCNPCNTRKNSLWPFTNEMKERIANEVRSLPTVKEVMP